MKITMLFPALTVLLVSNPGCEDDASNKMTDDMERDAASDGPTSTSFDNYQACQAWLKTISCGAFDPSTVISCDAYQQTTTCDISGYFECLTENFKCENDLPDPSGWAQCTNKASCGLNIDMGAARPDQDQQRTDSTVIDDALVSQPDAPPPKCAVWADWDCTPISAPLMCEATCVTEKNELYHLWVYDDIALVNSCKAGTNAQPVTCAKATFTGDPCSGCENALNQGCCQPQ